MGLSVCTKTMLSVFQIITDRRSSRLTVVPLAEKEMKANGAELTGGICKDIEKQGEIASLEVICSRTCWTAIPVAWAPTKRHPSHFHHLHHLPSPFLDLSYFLSLLKMPPCLLLYISPLLPFSFNKSYFFHCLFLSCALCSNFLVPPYISFPLGHKLKLIYREVEAL